jgi:hypothetical protein
MSIVQTFARPPSPPCHCDCDWTRSLGRGPDFQGFSHGALARLLPAHHFAAPRTGCLLRVAQQGSLQYGLPEHALRQASSGSMRSNSQVDVAEYVGDFLDNRRHGHGKMVFTCVRSYSHVLILEGRAVGSQRSRGWGGGVTAGRVDRRYGHRNRMKGWWGHSGHVVGRWGRSGRVA